MISVRKRSVYFHATSSRRSCGGGSTMKSARTEKIDGQDYFVVVRDVTMDSHPAYTGEKRLVDTAGRVEKFTSKFKRATKVK